MESLFFGLSFLAIMLGIAYVVARVVRAILVWIIGYEWWKH